MPLAERMTSEGIVQLTLVRLVHGPVIKRIIFAVYITVIGHYTISCFSTQLFVPGTNGVENLMMHC